MPSTAVSSKAVLPALPSCPTSTKEMKLTGVTPISVSNRSRLFEAVIQNPRTGQRKAQPVGGRGLGLPSSGRLRNKALTLRAIPATSCFATT